MVRGSWKLLEICDHAVSCVCSIDVHVLAVPVWVLFNICNSLFPMWSLSQKQCLLENKYLEQLHMWASTVICALAWLQAEMNTCCHVTQVHSAASSSVGWVIHCADIFAQHRDPSLLLLQHCLWLKNPRASMLTKGLQDSVSGISGPCDRDPGQHHRDSRTMSQGSKYHLREVQGLRWMQLACWKWTPAESTARTGTLASIGKLLTCNSRAVLFWTREASQFSQFSCSKPPQGTW